MPIAPTAPVDQLTKKRPDEQPTPTIYLIGHASLQNDFSHFDAPGVFYQSYVELNQGDLVIFYFDNTSRYE